MLALSIQNDLCVCVCVCVCWRGKKTLNWLDRKDKLALKARLDPEHREIWTCKTMKRFHCLPNHYLIYVAQTGYKSIFPNFQIKFFFY